MTKALSKEHYDNMVDKICSGCQRRLPVDNFRRRNDRPSKPYTPQCKECDVNRTLAYYARDDVDRMALGRLNKYGIDGSGYNRMLKEQNNTCYICKMPETAVNANGEIKSLAVDHCHTTGKIRRLLCSNHNQAIGIVRENIETLEAMIGYLQKHGGD